jgi:hypothetical protein
MSDLLLRGGRLWGRDDPAADVPAGELHRSETEKPELSTP